MPKKNRPATRAQKHFMAQALERGYVPLTPGQVKYFSQVVHGKGSHKAAAAARQRGISVRKVTARADAQMKRSRRTR